MVARQKWTPSPPSPSSGSTPALSSRCSAAWLSSDSVNTEMAADLQLRHASLTYWASSPLCSTQSKSSQTDSISGNVRGFRWSRSIRIRRPSATWANVRREDAGILCRSWTNIMNSSCRALTPCALTNPNSATRAQTARNGFRVTRPRMDRCPRAALWARASKSCQFGRRRAPKIWNSPPSSLNAVTNAAAATSRASSLD